MGPILGGPRVTGFDTIILLLTPIYLPISSEPGMKRVNSDRAR
jgi:hypothetical protein